MSIPNIMVFRPSLEEFQNFSTYIEYMESKGAHHAGLAKVIPPVDWIPRRRSYNDEDIMNMVIPYPNGQIIKGKQGIYTLTSTKKNPIQVYDYKKLTELSINQAPKVFDYAELERKYWKNITYKSSVYGADVSGSVTDSDVNAWNISRLGTILDHVNDDYKLTIEGVNTAYLYFGMWKATFPWHTEDMDLYSVNYLHYGHPKTWYAIPPKSGHRFQRLVDSLYEYTSCSTFLRHKMVVISPSVLKSHGILTNKITQENGEFMITFPFSYHMGFNHGFNIAESVNFATRRWVEYGKRTSLCSCYDNKISFSMDTFVKTYQPDRYQLWRDGKDIGCHPENPTHFYPAPVF